MYGLRLCIWFVSFAVLASGAPAQDQAITIWWAQWDPASGLQTVARAFEKETGIAVKVHQIPWPSYQEQVFLNFGNKQTDFDIVVGDSQWIGRGATKGLYLELTDWLPTAVDMDKIHPRAARYLCEYPAGSGRYYAAPCETDACGFVYRRDWFESPAEGAAFEQAYGRPLAPPATWSEFRDVAEFFHRPQEKRYGCSILTGRLYDSATMGFQMFLWSWGARWGDAETFQIEGHLNSQEAVEALTFMKDLVQFTPPGGNSADYFYNNDVFSNGSTAMMLNYFPFFPGIVEAMGDQVGFFMVPAHGEQRVVSLGGQGFSISTKTPASQQELAKRFIAWFEQTRVQREWIKHPGAFTADVELLASEQFAAAAPFNATFASSLDYLQDFWNVPVYNELLAVSQRFIGEAMDGVATPKEALDRMAEEHELIMLQANLLK